MRVDDDVQEVTRIETQVRFLDAIEAAHEKGRDDQKRQRACHLDIHERTSHLMAACPAESLRPPSCRTALRFVRAARQAGHSPTINPVKRAAPRAYERPRQSKLKSRWNGGLDFGSIAGTEPLAQAPKITPASATEPREQNRFRENLAN